MYTVIGRNIAYILYQMHEICYLAITGMSCDILSYLNTEIKEETF